MKYSFKGNLSSESIDNLSNEIEEYLDKKKIKKETAIKVRLTAEDILLFYRKTFDENCEITFTCSDFLGRIHLSLRVHGPQADPFADMGEEDYFLREIMIRENLQPVYSYRRNWNTLSFILPSEKNTSSFIILLISVALGIIFGLLARNSFPEAGAAFSEKWLTPLSSAIMGLLSTLSALMMFFSIISGIYSMGDVSTFQKIGKNLISRLLFSSFIGAVGSTALCLLFYPLQNETGSVWEAENLWQMIIEIIPTNVIEAFSTGNTLQIMFLAIFIGITLLILSSSVHALSEFMMQTDLLVQTMVQYVLNFLPISVFVSLFNLMVSGDTDNIGSSYRYPLFVLICCLCILLFYVLSAAARFRVSPLLLIKKTMPSALIAFSTGSTSSTFSTNMDICENKLGIDKQFVKIGIPLVQLLFVSTRTSTFVCASFILSNMFGASLSPAVLIPLILSSYIYSLAVPPITGATLSCFILLFNQIGVPSEALAIVIAFQPIIDRIVTSLRAIASQCDFVCVADRFGRVNLDILKNK